MITAVLVTTAPVSRCSTYSCFCRTISSLPFDTAIRIRCSSMSPIQCTPTSPITSRQAMSRPHRRFNLQPDLPTHPGMRNSPVHDVPASWSTALTRPPTDRFHSNRNHPSIAAQPWGMAQISRYLTRGWTMITIVTIETAQRNALKRNHIREPTLDHSAQSTIFIAGVYQDIRQWIPSIHFLMLRSIRVLDSSSLSTVDRFHDRSSSTIVPLTIIFPSHAQSFVKSS